MKVETAREQLLFSTIRIECDTPAGLSVGTAFVYHHPGEEADTSIPLLVTNKHVVSDATECRFYFYERDGDGPALGKRTDVVRCLPSDWYGHPDPTIDLAVLPFGLVLRQLEERGTEAFYRALGPQIIPSQEELEDLDAIEDVLFMGYPSGLFDKRHLTPIARSGATATPPSLDYGGRPVFLIDASVFPGSSGSPVFVSNHGTYFTREATMVGSRTYFLGVLAQVLQRTETGDVGVVEVPTGARMVAKTPQNLDLGVVFHARFVKDMAEKLAAGKLEKGVKPVEVPQ